MLIYTTPRQVHPGPAWCASLYRDRHHQEGGCGPNQDCARGSTSLESFHCHLKRFIPGTSANALNFQLYLLEGLSRWNQDRGTAAVTSRPSSLLTYSGDVTQCVNTSSLKVFGRAFVPNFRPPSKYTGMLM
ncbi:hypothetical protein EPR50_G00200470 [Perca flavescens]|uniref:Uncharacterized protein n=1 Tax=Perca flavescens TaxID=8167 RepID=A0A484C7Q1_PERFV|nr:hypothetical protein EPR50_G00200470 [Perca flavescens]